MLSLWHDESSVYRHLLWLATELYSHLIVAQLQTLIANISGTIEISTCEKRHYYPWLLPHWTKEVGELWFTNSLAQLLAEILIICLVESKCYHIIIIFHNTYARQRDRGKLWVTGILVMFQSMCRILRLEPASEPQNLRAAAQKFERVTARSTCA